MTDQLHSSRDHRRDFGALIVGLLAAGCSCETTMTAEDAGGVRDSAAAERASDSELGADASATDANIPDAAACIAEGCSASSCCPDFMGAAYCCGEHDRCSPDAGACFCGDGPPCPPDLYCCGARGIELYDASCVDYGRWTVCASDDI